MTNKEARPRQQDNRNDVRDIKDTSTSTEAISPIVCKPSASANIRGKGFIKSAKTGRDYPMTFIHETVGEWQPFSTSPITEDIAVEIADNMIEFLSLFFKMHDKGRDNKNEVNSNEKTNG